MQSERQGKDRCSPARGTQGQHEKGQKRRKLVEVLIAGRTSAKHAGGGSCALRADCGTSLQGGKKDERGMGEQSHKKKRSCSMVRLNIRDKNDGEKTLLKIS